MDAREHVRQWYRRVILLGLCTVQMGCVAFATLDTVVKDNRPADPEEMRTVQVVRQGARLSTRLHMNLQPGDEIITDAESTVWINFADGTDVILGPNTHVQILSIRAFFGKIFVRARGLFRVETEYVVAGTEGTEFLTIVNRPDEVSLIVLDGSVRLESKAQRWAPISVQQAERATIRGPESPQKQPVTPRELEEIRLWAIGIEQLIPPPEPIELPFSQRDIRRRQPGPRPPPRPDDTGRPPSPPPRPPSPPPPPVIK